MSKESETWAPTASKFEGGDVNGGCVSFEAYFLRDLYQQEKIDGSLIEDIIVENDMQVDVDDVMRAIADPHGGSIESELAGYIADVASVVAVWN
ncbi:hypothetical protein ACH9L7_16495 (plasmid) [Haloferax sp. S1W]|uniref:hypothetical protein n=1 Tax=Haloferax sp. S1W TaxID=3377110 RepID=UPI0037C59AAC